MRVRQIAGLTGAAAVCIALAACGPEKSDRSSDKAPTAGASVDNDQGGEASPVAPPVVPEELLEQLPGHLTQEKAMAALRAGILVTTQSGEACQSRPRTDEAGRIYMLIGMLKPNSSYPVSVKPVSNAGGKSLVGDMKLSTSDSTFIASNFKCEGWKPGKYRIIISTGDGGSLYEANAEVA